MAEGHPKSIVHDAENVLTEEAINYGIQPEGFNTRQVFGVTVVTIILTAAIIIAMIFLVEKVGTDTDIRFQQSLVYPELTDLRHRSEIMLNSYERIEGVDGQFRIPLTRAQELMVEEARLSAAEPSHLTDRASYNLASVRRDLSAVQVTEQETVEVTLPQGPGVYIPLPAEDAQE